ncbi:MAG: hypothetical protein ACLUEK_15785 [Oscillospiraceae bacterium]
MLYSEKVRVFLTSHGMEPERIDLAETTAAFLGEMELGLRGRESSLKIPTYSPPTGVLLWTSPPRHRRGRHQLPHRAGELHGGGAGHRLAERLRHARHGRGRDLGGLHRLRRGPPRAAARQGVKVGFCFSYPTEETPERDGRV